MDIVALIGRILFSAIFLSSAYGHFAQTAAMTGYAESKKVPAARLAVLGGGVLLLLGGLMVLLGVWGDLGALFLVVFLVPTALLMHKWSSSSRTRVSPARPCWSSCCTRRATSASPSPTRCSDASR